MDITHITLLLLFIGRALGRQPNILFILADDYGWNDIGYHQAIINTPTLDKLAAGGIKLESHYVQPVCTPTRSALLSGRMPIHSGMHKKLNSYEPKCHPLQDKFMPELLRDLGYATHMVGKWHLGFCREACLPANRGFDSYFGQFSGEQTYFTHIRNGYLDFSSQTSHTALTAERNYTGAYSTHVFAEKTQHIIVNHKATTPDQPLFIYLPFQAVHLPNQVPPEYKIPYKHFVDKRRQTYSAMVSCMDEAILNVTNTLKEQDMWENTIIVFSADNGGPIFSGASNWPLRGGKGDHFEGGIRVNAFVHSPLLKRSNSVVDDLFHITDWLPTLVHAAGGSTDGLDIDGIDQWETLRSGMKSARREILHDIDTTSALYGKSGYSNIFDTRLRAAVRVGDWKLITGKPGHSKWHIKPDASKLEQHRGDGKLDGSNVRLYNVKSDPTEDHDVSDKNPDMVETLLMRLQFYNSSTMYLKWPARDHTAAPKSHNGFWKPWLPNENIKLSRGLAVNNRSTIYNSAVDTDLAKMKSTRTTNKKVMEISNDVGLPVNNVIYNTSIGINSGKVKVIEAPYVNNAQYGENHAQPQQWRSVADIYILVILMVVVVVLIKAMQRVCKRQKI